jgi:CRP-like cAMP-binding protein
MLQFIKLKKQSLFEPRIAVTKEDAYKRTEHPTYIKQQADRSSATFSELWEKLLGNISPTIYPPGIQVLQQGSGNSDIYSIQHGLIKLKSIDRAGHETIIAVRRSGTLVGVAAAIVHEPNLASAVTVTECSLKRFPTQQFCKVIQEYPELSWHLHQLNASELLETRTALLELKSYSAERRLKRLLFQVIPELGNTHWHNGGVRLPFRHWEIAQILGVTPEHLSRLLRRLEKEGFLDRKIVS